MSSKEENKKIDDEAEDSPEEETLKVEFKPIVELKEVPVVTLEEDENTVFKM